MAPALVFPLLLALQGQISVSVGGKLRADSAKIRAAELESIMEDIRNDTSNSRRVPRRVAVTPEMLTTAFKDPAARTLLERARIARLRQDSALLGYDAKAYERVSVGLGVHFLGRDRLAFRHEDAARVRWRRGSGAWVEMTGSRSVVPIVNDGDADANVSRGLAPIPYYPGRDNLWVGSGMARAEVDDRELIHPLAVGAEAYYTYQTGDSVTMTLPDGQTITLRELRIAAREPKWNVTVGSFWFDMRTAQLVRAVYRLSTPMDIWAVAEEEDRRERTDTLANGKLVRPGRGDSDDGAPGWVKAMMSPMKADISGITVEYGLYNQRFWLPRTQGVEGYAQVSFMRVPVTFEQRFQYESVNGADSIPTIKPSERLRVRAMRDSLRAAGVDSLVRDSIVRGAIRARAAAIVKEREQQCSATGSYTSYRTQANGSLRVGFQVPCDSAKLANSPDLPASIYDANEQLFGTAERDDLMQALTFGLQPGWSPQRPALAYGLALTRYNRVEGLSTAISATSELGKGYTAALTARGSYADRQLNGELALSRSNGRTTWHGAVYRRLQASDDWGNPLSFGASLSSLLYARDEGAYYRAWGGEVMRTPEDGDGLELRFFGEQQWGDSLHSRWTLFGGGNDVRFIPNPMATRVTTAGIAARIRPQWGLNPDGFRVITDFRGEVATGDSTYVRGLFDATMTVPVGPAATALTVSAGAAGGGLPLQRRFYLGGSQSIRGQTALTAAGNAFWMARAEVGTRDTGIRTVLFGDLGWAGDRNDWSAPGRPLSGAGIGWSFLDGLVRADLARGIWPAQQWRFDMRLDARF